MLKRISPPPQPATIANATDYPLQWRGRALCPERIGQPCYNVTELGSGDGFQKRYKFADGFEVSAGAGCVQPRKSS